MRASKAASTHAAAGVQLFPSPEWLDADQPFRPEVQAEHYRGSNVAIRRCGEWPFIGTVEQYIASVERAERECDFSIQCWHRWAFNITSKPTGKRLELGSARLFARSETARRIAQGRRHLLELLLNEQGRA